PIVGGVIAHTLGWRWAFFINIPIGIVLALATLHFITDSNDENARRLDPIGIVSFAATMFALTWGLINGQAHGWMSPIAVVGFVGGVAGLMVFLIAENAQQRPMLDLSLFRNPRFIGGVW